MKYKAILFDLDGTLLDTIEDLSNSTNTVLDKEGFPTHSVEEYKYFIGGGMKNLIKNALPQSMRTDTVINHCLSLLKEEYSKRWAEKTHPYKGIPELLNKLAEKNIKMSILSNKAHEFTIMIVEKFLSDWKFQAVFGERSSIPRKPNPAAALEISEMLDIPPREFLYLGDSGTDMKTANAAGMFAVGALWGFRKKEELVENGAMTLISKPGELLELL